MENLNKKMNQKEIIKDGIKNSLKICFNLGKIIVPLLFIFTFLKYTPVFEKMASYLSPVMNFIGLSGSAAFPVILGLFFNLYAAIGSIIPLQMSVKQITIISLMLLTAHTLILEAIVFKKLKIRYVNLIIFRILMAFIIGYFVNLVMV